MEAPAPPAKRRRLDPQVRAAMILDKAANFVARHGFDVQVHDLAEELGISQALIFRYFGTKQNLIDKVCERVIVQRWSESWVSALNDRSKPLRERLEAFYLSYLTVVDDYNWIRIALFAGLAGNKMLSHYAEGHVEEALAAIARELSARKGRRRRGPVSDVEHELVWHLHSTFIYYLIRKHAFNLRTMPDRAVLVRRVIDNFLSEFGLEE